MNKTVKFLRGDVFIRTSLSLDDTAKEISMALSINLEQAPTGRFEEYEGYQGDAVGFMIHLIGDDLSKPRPTNHNYQLSIMPSSRLAFEENTTLEEVDISSFLERVLTPIPNLKIST